MKKRRLVVDYETLPETSESFIYSYFRISITGLFSVAQVIFKCL
jgi:hypothetical protein